MAPRSRHALWKVAHMRRMSDVIRGLWLRMKLGVWVVMMDGVIFAGGFQDVGKC